MQLWRGLRWDSSCSLHLGHRIFGAFPILYIAGFKGKKIDKFIPDRKNATIIAFDKPIRNRFSANIRTENMVSSHPLSLTMKYRFEKFAVKISSFENFWKTFTFLVSLLLWQKGFKRGFWTVSVQSSCALPVIGN